MKYLINTEPRYNPKNKLHQDVLKFVKSLDRLMVDEIDIHGVIDNCFSTIRELEQKHPRTKPTAAFLERPDERFGTWDYIIYVPGLLNVHFLASKGEVTL